MGYLGAMCSSRNHSNLHGIVHCSVGTSRILLERSQWFSWISQRSVLSCPFQAFFW